MSDVTEIRVLLEVEGISDEEAKEIVDWFWDLDAEDIGFGEGIHGMAAVVPEEEQGPEPMPDLTMRDEFPDSREELIKMMRAQIAMTALADPDFINEYGEQIAEDMAEREGLDDPREFGDLGH